MIFLSLNQNDIDRILDIQKDNFSDGWNFKQLQSGFKENLSAIGLEIDGELVGFITYTLVIDTADIEGVVVINSERNKGYGRLLVEKALKELKDKGAKSALLEVRETNAPAKALYSACGFKQISIRKKYYSDGENAVVMQKEI